MSSPLTAAPYVLVLYYSRSGSTQAMARQAVRGINTVEGIEARLRTVPAVSADCEVSADPVPGAGPAYASLDDLRHCAGLVLGSPTRFGNMAAPLKYFIDQTSELWLNGAMIDKPAAVFTSTGSLHGGQESTLLSMQLPLFHHGMLLVGLPYSEPGMMTTAAAARPTARVTGAAAMGRGVPTAREEALCRALGRRVATLSVRLHGARGRMIQRGRVAQRIWIGLWLSLAVLLTTQGVYAWQRSAPVAVWMFWFLPLLVLFPGLYRDRLRSVVWLSFVSLMYFLWSVLRVFAQPDSLRAQIELLAVVVLFLCAMFYIRRRARELRAVPEMPEV